LLGVSDASSVDAFLSQAEEREKAYDWLGAAEFYRKALNLMPRTGFLKLGHVQEKTGYAFYRAAMQAESANEFRERMRKAVACYERVKDLYSRLSETGKTPWMLRCDAMIAFVGYWLALEASGKKRLLDECWRITKEALRAFKEIGDALGYGKTYNQLSMSAGGSFALEENFQVQENTVKEAVEHGEQAIKLLSTCRDSYELARAYVHTTNSLGLFGYFFHDLDGREKCFQKARDYWQKAIELSEEVAFSAELSYGIEPLSLNWGWGTDKALKHCEKALEYARRTRDRLGVGYTLESLATHAFWRAQVEDPNKAVKSLKRALQYAEDAKRQYSTISFISFGQAVLWIEAPYAEYYWALALLETNLSKRQELLEKAMEAIPALLGRAEESGSFLSIVYAHHVVSKVLMSQAMMETNLEEKKRLLEKALTHNNENNRRVKQHFPFGYWFQGVIGMYLARTKYELADLSKDLESGRNMLQEAAVDAENALKLCVKDLAFFDRGGTISQQNHTVGNWQYVYGNLLKRLYDVTRNKEYLMKAIEAFEDSAESMQKLDIISRVAESNWKIAQMHDALTEHLKAAESFTLASSNYRTAAEKIPQLKDLYQDFSFYMQAWCEIEKARHYHEKQEYGSAKEHYENAATLHKSLKQWSYLAPNYSAWASIENAEDLSRREQSEEALQTFEQAAKLFTETRRSLEAKLGEIENLDEKNMATNLTRASDIRRKYCIGRMALEEAKILDKKGDHYSSSQKYGEVAQISEKIIQTMESEHEKKEFELIATLSQAWQRMTRAEAEESPNLYQEASQLFEEAKDLSPNEQAKILMIGHSRFCKALEVGTRFVDTRDPNLHTTATEQLFDAYMQVDNAKRESDPEKKTKFYAMAEKVLQSSAGSFMKAEHPEKREQVLRLLEKVKEERELATSLCEILHTPPIVSATTTFGTPAPTHENAVGSERFEHADIQTNLIARQKELKVGESLGLEIELVNSGKGPALLTKITELIPQGFELAEKPEIYRVEDSYIDMKGKRLDPLKMVEVKMVLKPRVQGAFLIKPRVLYIDEDGKYKSHEPEPVTITVKELGIRGWIKGER